MVFILVKASHVGYIYMTNYVVLNTSRCVVLPFFEEALNMKQVARKASLNSRLP